MVKFHMIKRSLTAALVLAVSASVAQAQRDTSIVTGRITSEGGVPIPSAIVSIPRLRLSAQTNDAGTYRLIVAGLGTRAETLHVTRLGYRPKDVPFSLAQGTVTVNAEMQATAVALDQIVVTGT